MAQQIIDGVKRRDIIDADLNKQSYKKPMKHVLIESAAPTSAMHMGDGS